MTQRFYNPRFQSLDDAGIANENGRLFFYEQGTTTFQDTYRDSGLTIVNTNPVVTTAGSRMPDIWLQSLNYTVRFEIDGVEVWTSDIDGNTVPIATDTTPGIVELATAQEMQDGVATDRVPSVSVVTNNIRIDSSQIISGILNSSRLPAATTSLQGAVELATQAEMDAGAMGVVPTADIIKTFVDTAVGTGFTGSLTTPGYIQFPPIGGIVLKMQWGSQSIPGNSQGTISYPMPFTTFANPSGSGGQVGNTNDDKIEIQGTTLTNFTVYNSSGTGTFFWIAVGV